MTALPPSPFISDSAGLVMLPADPAVATMTPSLPTAAAGPFWDEYDRDQKLRALYDLIDPPQPPLFLRTGRITDYQPDPSLKHILKVFFAM